MRGPRVGAALLVLLAASARADDLLWHVTGVALGPRAVCRDGDSLCDRDGRADGACSFGVALCRDGTVASSVRVRGAGAAAVRQALAALAADATCTPEVPVLVRAGRRARLVAAGQSERRRLRLTCSRAPRPRAVVVTTDFETGLLATVGVPPPHRVTHPTTPIHSDAVVRVAGDRVYIVNRFLGDNLQVLDPRRGLATLLQCSTGPGSNPHDVAVLAPDKAYVTRYDAKELWVVDPSAASCAAFLRATVDLSPWGDADGLPEMDQMALVGDRLFVSLERLDRARGFAPSGRSRLAVIDTETDAVTAAVDLSGANAFGDASGLVREPGTGKLVIAEAGNVLKKGDGGLERVDPYTLQADGAFFVDENQLGGNVLDFVLLSATKGYAVLQDASLQNRLVDFDPTGARAPRTVYSRQAYLPDIALGPDGLLWLADQGLPDPGIRLFDTTTDRPVLHGPLNVGLPPFSIGFLP